MVRTAILAADFTAGKNGMATMGTCTSVLLVGRDDGVWAETVVGQHPAAMWSLGHFIVAQHSIIFWSGTREAMQSLNCKSNTAAVRIVMDARLRNIPRTLYPKLAA